MTQHPVSITDERGAIPVMPDAGVGEAKDSGRAFLRPAGRDLTSEEAATPAGVRWLLYEADRLEKENRSQQRELDDLKKKYDDLTTRYHDNRVSYERAIAKGNISVQNEILSSLALAGGSAGLSLCTSYFAVSGAFAFALAGTIVSAVLFVGSIVFRIYR